MKRIKICFSFVVSILISLSFFPAFGLADNTDNVPVLTLERAKNMAQQGPDNKLINITYDKAQEGLVATKKELGVGVITSKDLQESIDNIDNRIYEWENAISLLEDNIEEWEKDLTDLNEDSSDYLTIKENITHARKAIHDFKDNITEARKNKAAVFVNQQVVKTVEENVKSVLDPVKAGADKASDAKFIQPKIIEYKVEEMYLTLLIINDQIEYQKRLLQNINRDLRIEQIKLDLGLSSILIINQYEENARKIEDALRSTEDLRKNTERLFRRLIGLPVNFNFQLEPIKLVFVDALKPEKFTIPDLTKTVNYIRAEENVQKKKDDLNDFNIFDRDKEKYRIAELSLAETQIQLEQTLFNLEANYRKSYESLVTADQQLHNAYLNLEATKERQEIAKLQYELGLISKIDLEKSELTLIEVELNYEKARVDKHLALLAYQLAKIGIEI